MQMVLEIILFVYLHMIRLKPFFFQIPYFRLQKAASDAHALEAIIITQRAKERKNNPKLESFTNILFDSRWLYGSNFYIFRFYTYFFFFKT